MKNCLIPFFGTVLLLMACGDEVTNISEYGGADTVKAFKDLGKCDKSAIGKFVYVSDSVKVYACTDDGWTAVTGTDGSNGKNGTNGKNGKDGADGKDGTDGKSCTMTAFKDGSGFDVICDGKSIGSVKNGADGADGKDGSNGKDGTSCSVAKAEDSDDAVVTCGKTSVTIHNGVDGKPGAPGTKGTDGTNGTDGANGSDGASCKIVSDMDGVVQIQCGEGKNATTTKLYKAICGTKPYDPEKSFCTEEGEANPLCDGKTYDVKKKFCSEKKLVDLCGGESYDPSKEFCNEDEVHPLCNGKKYDPATYECVNGEPVEVLKSCGDELYNAHAKFCFNNKTYPLCNGEEYDVELETCENGKKVVVYEKCGDEKYKVADADHLFCAEFVDKTTEEKTYQIYKYTTIEVKSKDYSETWMAENLNYETENSRCYENKESNCEIYGRLYSLAAAKDACPNGWRLPSLADWEGLIYAVNKLDQTSETKNNAGEVLKSSEKWGDTGNGSDLYGFSALPGGARAFINGVYFEGGLGLDAYFWSSRNSGKCVHLVNESTAQNKVIEASIEDMSPNSQFSVRCIKNAESN